MFENAAICHGLYPWYLVHCQARKELFAASTLQSSFGMAVFLPRLKTKSQGRVRFVSFFPGYLFAQIDLQRVPPSKINTTPGVLRLVEFGGEPEPVPHAIVKEISARLEYINAFDQQPLLPGEAVYLKKGGPLQDLEMIFVGPVTPGKRVCVLLDILGRLKEVYVDPNNLERVAPPYALSHQFLHL